MDFDAGPAFVPPSSTIDWASLKREIVSRLEIPAEYAALGLRLAGHVNGSTGKVQAHAMGRQDDSPSAFISTQTGIYHAHGDPPETLGFFDFALRYGQFGEWLEVLRHYAEKAGVEVPRVKKTGKGWVEEAIYDYRSESGELLYQVIRYRQPNGKKTFRQRRPDGKGGWLYNLENTRRVLFHLPELLAADPSRTVLVVEGEKDVETLSGTGLLAVSAPQGAEAAGRRQWEDGAYTGSLAARSVVVIPDNDPPGHSLAQLIARTIQPVAASVRILHLEDLPPKGDVSDWLESGHETEELVRLAEAAPLYDPEPAQEPPKAEATGKPALTVCAADVADIDPVWIWEDRLPEAFLTLFAGQTGLGKSFLACHLASCLTTGRPMPGQECGGEIGSVLIVSEDPHEMMLVPRLIEMQADRSRIRFMTWEAMASYCLDDVVYLERACNEFAQFPRLVIIDPPTNFLGETDEHRNSEVRSMLMGLVRWLVGKGTACILIHHVNKQVGKGIEAINRVMGSIAWVTVPRIAHVFVRDPDDPDRCIFACPKNNLGPLPKPLGYRIVKTGPKRAKLEWLGEIDTTADEAMGGEKRPRRAVVASEWLTERFRLQREWDSTVIRRDAAEHAISKNALWEAKGTLPIKARKHSRADGEQYWVWVAEEGWPPEIAPENPNLNGDGNLGNVGNHDW